MRFVAFALLAVASVSGNEVKKICEPGTTAKKDCNDCWCSEDGTFWACTLMACEPDTRFDHEVTEESGKVGETNFQNSGIISHVPLPLRHRRQVSHDRPCVPGTKFNVYCNTCACGDDGFSVICTRMRCDERIYNEDGSLKNIGEFPNNSLLRQKRQVSHNRPCVPGTKFNIYCNTCSCGSDGFSVACTRQMCPEGMYNEDGSLKSTGQVPNNPLLRQKRQLSQGQTCEPGKIFKDYCNTCSCARDGVSKVCTMMACDESVWNKDGSLKNAGQVPSNALLRQKRQVSHNRPCVPGTKFNIYCNTCSCGSDGFSVACTREMCPEGMYNEDGSLKSTGEVPNNALLRQKRQLSQGQTCEPGKTFKDYCNTCSCGPDGVSSVCTLMACDESVWNRDGTLKNVEQVPNNALLRQKRQLSEGQTCEPGTTFKYYCNTCTCGPDGQPLMCTRMGCVPGMFNQDGSLKNVGQVPNDVSFRQKRQLSQDAICEPGTRFKMYCNTCGCGQDGRPVFCTRMACPPGMFNEDGSLKVAL